MSSEIGEGSIQSDFNYLVYLEINPDIDSGLNEKDTIIHYLTSGKKDGRIYKYMIDGLPDDFDYLIYKELNYDLRCLNEVQIKHHYLKCAKDDGREYKYRTDGLPLDFDHKIYLEINSDLPSLNEDQSKHHYLKYGRDENRDYKKILYKLIPIQDIKKEKICLIYVYYERKNEQKNQTNLSFFIKYGLDKTKWLNLDITYLFVINGHQCEVIIPNENNIHVLKEDNCSDYEGWYNGIKYFEDLNNNKIWEQFDYLCLMNASTCGPFMEEDINSHWLIPFYERMNDEKAVACSPYMNKFINEGNILSCHMTLLKINSKIINILINEKEIYGEFTNTILGKKENKTDAILTGEFGLSKILLKNYYKISNLYFDYNNYNIKYTDDNNDREEFYHKNNDLLKKTIFIKNSWRYYNDTYSSIPVLYEYCENFINKKLRMNNIFKNISELNYNILNKNNSGINTVSDKYNWNTKEEYYSLYGKADEIIVFPLKINNNNSCAIYAHYDSNNLIADYVISGIKALIIIGYDIIFYTSSEKINNVDLETLPFKVNFIKNENVGTDWKIWLNALNYINNNDIKYDWILLLNDSLLFPINGIDNFRNSINNMRIDSDFWGHWDSNEVRWHIIGTPIEFRYKLLNDVIYFITKNIVLCKIGWDYVTLLETCFAQYLVDKGYNYNVIIKENTLKFDKKACPSHNAFILEQWIFKKNAFAIKWKYVISYLKNTHVSSEFNFLSRFMYYGPYGYISNGEKKGLFIKSEDYYKIAY